MFRMLKANEIDVRVQSVKANGFVALLYKDARADMNILDETVTPLGWKREHTRDNANCIVSIWDDKKTQWITKEDTGTESNTEKEKGLASDSFKRACFNWGIGRELYSSPFIWVSDLSYVKAGKVYEKFRVSNVEYDENKEISYLVLIDSRGKTVFSWGKDVKKPTEPVKNTKKVMDRTKAIELIESLTKDKEELLKKQLDYHKITSLIEATDNSLRMIYKYFKK